MSTSSPRTLRNGKLKAPTSSNVLIKSSSTQLMPSTENNNNSSDEQVQSGRNLPTNVSDPQQANEERFNHLQIEMSTLKTMMERLIAQSEERNRQLDASAATSSFAVRASNRAPPLFFSYFATSWSFTKPKRSPFYNFEP